MTKKEYCIKHAPIASHEYYTSHIHGIKYGINDYVYVSQKRQLKLFSGLYKWDFHKCKVYTDQNGEMYFNFTEKNYNGTKTTTRRYLSDYIRRGTWLPEISPETWEKECKEV